VSTPTLNMLAAVDAAIAKVRETHDGIPEVTVVLGASGKMRKGQKHGHFAPKSWVDRAAEENEAEAGHYGEILLAGESLSRGAVATLGTVIHELAHAYCDANEIKDTSNGNRYHNKRFKEVAEEFGLTIERADVIGWSLTDVPPETQEFYADEIKALEEAITQYRVGQVEVKVTQKQKKFMAGCVDCGDAVQVTKGWAERNEFRFFCQEHGVAMEFWEEVPE
jgi:hypothetical protein